MNEKNVSQSLVDELDMIMNAMVYDAKHGNWGMIGYFWFVIIRKNIKLNKRHEKIILHAMKETVEEMRAMEAKKNDKISTE